MFETWDVEDGMGGSSLKIIGLVWNVLECHLEKIGSLLHDQTLPGDLDTIALWNIVSIRFNFAIKLNIKTLRL